MSNELRSKTIRAMGHLGLGSAMGKVMSLGTTLILARILSPADYGLIAIAMIVIGFIGFFNEVGIGSAIVQKTELTTTEVNGCFVIALMVSSVLVCLTVASSGLIADFYEHPQLKKMISVLASGFIFGAFSTVPMAFLRKDMQFKAIAGVNILATLIQSIVSLVLALLGYGVWSLVWGFVTASIVTSTGFFLLSSWRPRGAYGIREASNLVIYGLHVTSTRIFWYLYTNADKAIVGKMLGAKSLGIYDMAFSLATLPSAQITTLVINVASPLFSKLQKNLAELSSVMLQLTRGVAYVTYPMLIGMLVCGHELIMVLLGPDWIDVLIPFRALCLMGLIKSVDPLLSQVLTSTGNAKKLSAYTAMCSVVMLLGVVVGAMLDGLRGVSIVWVLIYPLLSVKLLRDVSAVIGMPMLAYYRTLLPVLSGTVAMGAVVLAVRELTISSIPSVHALLALEIVSGVISYFFWIVYLDKKGLAQIRQTLIDLGISETRLNRWPFIRHTEPT
ncbi:lipopolysaccharide biosynthesis protein [Undibacterium sp. RuTC16W]|uniref:lipopolysaccharide biosynthesis protein n=1 Tax=Undibacterium sp. RuTC16W TaxID=3413048 RepID=UPI003BF24F35